MHYRCYFVQKDGLPAAWRFFESEGDGEASDYALGLLVAYPLADMIEVWEDARPSATNKSWRHDY